MSGLVAHLSATRPAPARATLATDPLADPLWDLLWRRYLPQRYGDGVSLREISRRTHVSKSVLARHGGRLDDALDELEWDTFATLERSFVDEGLCEMLLHRLGSVSSHWRCTRT
ncbi:hypothetical protein [Paraburkholderia sediminicola]|uniref:hypothetical protein n=1 Tax=Paraburkholderia sediminicola TaxID=458836 RepID=UPI0038BE0DCA